MSKNQTPEELLKDIAKGLSPNTLVNLISLASKGANLTEKPGEMAQDLNSDQVNPSGGIQSGSGDQSTSVKETSEKDEKKDESIEIVSENLDIKTRQEAERKKRAAALEFKDDEDITASKISKTVSILSIFIYYHPKSRSIFDNPLIS